MVTLLYRNSTTYSHPIELLFTIEVVETIVIVFNTCQLIPVLLLYQLSGPAH